MPLKYFTVTLLVFLCSPFVLGAVKLNDVKPGYVYAAKLKHLLPPPQAKRRARKNGTGTQKMAWNLQHPVIALGDPDKDTGLVQVAALSHGLHEAIPKAPGALYSIPASEEKRPSEVDLVRRAVSIENMEYLTDRNFSEFFDWHMKPEDLQKLENARVPPDAENSWEPPVHNTQKSAEKKNPSGGPQGVVMSGPSSPPGPGSSDTPDADGWQAVTKQRKGKVRRPAQSSDKA